MGDGVSAPSPAPRPSLNSPPRVFATTLDPDRIYFSPILDARSRDPYGRHARGARSPRGASCFDETRPPPRRAPRHPANRHRERDKGFPASDLGPETAAHVVKVGSDSRASINLVRFEWGLISCLRTRSRLIRLFCFSPASPPQALPLEQLECLDGNSWCRATVAGLKDELPPLCSPFPAVRGEASHHRVGG